MVEMHRETRHPARLLHALLKAQEEENNPIIGTNDEDNEEMNIPAYCVEMTRMLVTPTREAVNGFGIEMSNRVVRHFVINEGFSPFHFLRVSIGDENGERLFNDDLSRAVCDRIKELILEGLKINGNDYNFLAYSSSQLKELSLWMVCCPSPWNVKKMREWMGNFTVCKTPSKYAARMGQCFSTTIQASETTSYSDSAVCKETSQLRVHDGLSDILCCSNENKEMLHSDGTGLVRKEKMVDLARKLPFAPRDVHDVSVLQIRFGGAKGTLTAWDFDTLTANGALPDVSLADVLLRPSMVKFEAPYRHLEVISIGKHVPYYLNRHVLLLLGVHQVPDETFLRMQQVMLDNLNDMLSEGKKAAEMLPRLSGPDSSLRSTLVHMISCGLSPHNEPFLFSCAHAVRSHHLMQLRKKSRVFVKKGAVLIGGLDETGQLPEGCVFVQLRPSGVAPDVDPRIKDNAFQVLTGPVMVTKHPVMHPGDVRMLLAVDVPELRGHKNMILFSQHGSRPETDKMSGSDLDGDQFAVTWDERLFLNEWNSCRKLSSSDWKSRSGEMLSLWQGGWEANARLLQGANKAPLDFGAIGEAPSFDRIEDTNLIDHFINYAKSDNLGRISMLWLDHAAKKGADCEECLQLAKLASIAVDFPKSGIPAEIPKELTISRVTPRAHWREKKNAESFHCESIVGKLYDDVVSQMRSDKTRKEQCIAMAGRGCDRHGQIACFMDRKKSSPLSEHLKQIYMPHISETLGMTMPADVNAINVLVCGALFQFAVEQRLSYEDQLTVLMSKYKLHSEGELLTGCIRKYHKLHKRRQHDLSEEIRRQSRELRLEYRASFFRNVLQMVFPHDPIVSDEAVDIDLTDEQDRLDEVETAVAESKNFLHYSGEGSEPRFFSTEEVHCLRICARQLAAAYYVVTYHPQMRWRSESAASRAHDRVNYSGQVVLFSFPWIVSDVMACAFNE